MFFSPIINNFLLSQWLWSITWGIYHIPINIIIMFILFKILLRLPTIFSLLIIFAAHIGACMVFMVSMLMVLKHVHYTIPHAIPYTNYTMMIDVFGLGVIYSILHICFFALIARWQQLPLVLMSAVTILSNMLTTLLILFLVSR